MRQRGVGHLDADAGSCPAPAPRCGCWARPGPAPGRSASAAMRATRTPSPGSSANCVTAGPELISRTRASTPNVASVSSILRAFCRRSRVVDLDFGGAVQQRRSSAASRSSRCCPAIGRFSCLAISAAERSGAMPLTVAGVGGWGLGVGVGVAGSAALGTAGIRAAALLAAISSGLRPRMRSEASGTSAPAGVAARRWPFTGTSGGMPSCSSLRARGWGGSGGGRGVAALPLPRGRAPGGPAR